MAGAPGRLAGGEIEIGVSAAGVPAPISPTVHMAVGVSDAIAVEAGVHALPQSTGGWTLGFVGLRYSSVPSRRSPVHFAGDLEFGAGAGAGGTDDTTSHRGNAAVAAVAGDWLHRAAGGGYLGFGFGYHIHWLSFYLRARTDIAAASSEPVTIWTAGLLGLEVDIRHVAQLGAGGGPLIVWSQGAGAVVYPMVQVSLTFRFPYRPAPSAPPPIPRPARPLRFDSNPPD